MSDCRKDILAEIAVRDLRRVGTGSWLVDAKNWHLTLVSTKESFPAFLLLLSLLLGNHWDDTNAAMSSTLG